MTQRHCRICDGWHDLDKPWPRKCAGHFGERKNRSGLPAPMIICDTMDPVQSMVTGEWHDSKSSLRAEYRREGVVELGNDTVTPSAPDESAEIAETQRAVATACEILGY